MRLTIKRGYFICRSAMQSNIEQQTLDAYEVEHSNQNRSTDDVETESEFAEPRLLELEKSEVNELRETVRQTLETRQLRSQKREIGEEIAAQSDRLSYRHGMTVDASSTAELQDVQAEVGIGEQTIRELQAEAGVQRLYPSRRKDFIVQVLEERIETRAKARIDAEQLRETAENEITQLFGQQGGVVTLTWKQRDDGSFSSSVRDDEAPDVVATIQHATTEFSETELPGRTADVVVLDDGADVTVESPFGTQSFTLDRGAFKIRARSIRSLAREAGLIVTEMRAAACTSRDKEALDIGVDEDENRARVIELESGTGGYSRRYTKAWTEYRDFDPDREMVLITTGKKTFFGRSLRGVRERTWLIGRDEGQVWTHRVYNTHHTIDEALAFMKPAEVKRFEAEGRQVTRQGDVYFVQMIQQSNFEALEGTRHDVVQGSDETVVITHPGHEDLELTGEWKAILNNDGSQSQSSRCSRRAVRD